MQIQTCAPASTWMHPASHPAQSMSRPKITQSKTNKQTKKKHKQIFSTAIQGDALRPPPRIKHIIHESIQNHRNKFKNKSNNKSTWMHRVRMHESTQNHNHTNKQTNKSLASRWMHCSCHPGQRSRSIHEPTRNHKNKQSRLGTTYLLD